MLLPLLLLAAAPGPVDLPVPEALRAKTCQPELSGITWVPQLRRYLVLSDDTGLLDTPSWHSPWLFSLDVEGRFDPAPRVLEGLDELDDAESITPGPEGTYFLTTSHALSKKGKSKPPRRQLLWLALEGERLRAKGRFDLTTFALPELVTGHEAELDIEALAFRDGALFVGLKAPLDDAGRAAIVRIDDATALFTGGKKRALPQPRVWARPKLEVPDAEGKPVPEGVTDLLFLPDGTLLVAANAPKSGAPDGGGAVWRLAGPDAAPVLVQRFPGLKPEGLTLSPDGRQVVVVFDRGPEAAQWVRLPLPR
ncbi:MAG: esterase-like activity of phytase family protein [Myxococcota bacterium]